MYYPLENVFCLSLLFAACCKIGLAVYSGSGTAIQDLTRRGQYDYPYHGAFGNKPPAHYSALKDPLFTSGRDLNSVSTCTKALGYPNPKDCARLVDSFRWGIVQTAWEQGVMTEHLEENYVTLPRIYSYRENKGSSVYHASR